MKNMISIFKTSVSSKKKAMSLAAYLNNLKMIRQWNFDLEDHDRILRIDSERPISMVVIGILNRKGFDCVELD